MLKNQVRSSLEFKWPREFKIVNNGLFEIMMVDLGLGDHIKRFPNVGSSLDQRFKNYSKWSNITILNS